MSEVRWQRTNTRGLEEPAFKHQACRSQPASRINLIQRFSTFQPCSNFLDQIYRQKPRSGRAGGWVDRNSVPKLLEFLRWSVAESIPGSRMTSTREDVDLPREIYSTIWWTGELFQLASCSPLCASFRRTEFCNIKSSCSCKLHIRMCIV